MSRLLLLLFVCSQATGFLLPKNREQLTGQELVDYVNSKQKLFKAELSKFTKEEMNARAMDIKYAEIIEDDATFAEEIEMDDNKIPASFDAREQWKNCASVATIWNQTNCDACWAISSASVMSDRTCIATGKQITLSPEEILTCCRGKCGLGCEGGVPERAFRYWSRHGVVTGGFYGTTDNCQPYQFNGQGRDNVAYTCAQKCQKSYNVTYFDDKHKGAGSYYLQNKVSVIQKEIMTNGPIVATYDIYEDFMHYKSGIYVHTTGEKKGTNAVKMLGWGTENGTPYWICANSWGSSWGENGYSRILRGTNEVSIEKGCSAGTVKV